MKRCFVVALAIGVLLYPAQRAEAKMGVWLSLSPSPPQLRERAEIRLRPFWTFPDGNRPALVTYPFSVEAVSPRGNISHISVIRSADPYVWIGHFVFRRAGRWEVRVANWGPRYEPYPGHRP